MFLDLDNFKNVNDVYGHNTGDLVLKTIAKILTENAPDAYAIRLGGDEFVLLFKGIHSKESLCSIAQNIIDNISNKSYFLDINVYLSASIGLLYHETVTESLDSILAKSDMAMYYAKTHGKSQFIVFNDIAQSVFSEIEMENHSNPPLTTMNLKFGIFLLSAHRPHNCLCLRSAFSGICRMEL